eukprot:365569-Chlamydomonas_euryale.AAC.35
MCGAGGRPRAVPTGVLTRADRTHAHLPARPSARFVKPAEVGRLWRAAACQACANDRGWNDAAVGARHLKRVQRAGEAARSTSRNGPAGLGRFRRAGPAGLRRFRRAAQAQRGRQ